MLVKQDLQLILAEVIREEHSNNFIHALILKNKDNEAVVGWYNSPVTSRKYFHDMLKQKMLKHNVRYLAGDLNARHPRWCTANDDQRRGQQLLKMLSELKDTWCH